jgi:hypothetical protein
MGIPKASPTPAEIAVFANVLRDELRKHGFSGHAFIAVKRTDDNHAEIFADANCTTADLGNLMLNLLMRLPPRETQNVMSMLINEPNLCAHIGVPPANVTIQQVAEEPVPETPAPAAKKEWMN